MPAGHDRGAAGLRHPGPAHARGDEAVEFDAAAEFALLSKLSIGWALLCLAITLPFVKTRRLRLWWYAPPLAMLTALAVRLSFFPPYGS